MKITKENVEGVDYNVAGCTLTGSCASAATDFVKEVILSDTDTVDDGMTIACIFAHENTAGNAPHGETIYSSDGVNFFADPFMTQPVTLAPASCCTVTATAVANEYHYVSFPIISVSGITGRLYTSHGGENIKRLWKADENVILLYKRGKFYIINDNEGSGTSAGVTFNGTRAQYEVAKLIPQGEEGYIPPKSLVRITDEDDFIYGKEVEVNNG